MYKIMLLVIITTQKMYCGIPKIVSNLTEELFLDLIPAMENSAFSIDHKTFHFHYDKEISRI